MKYFASVIFLVIISAFSLYGQTEESNRSLQDHGKDTIKRRPFRYHKDDFGFYRDRVPVPEMRPDIDPKRFFHEPPTTVIPPGERPGEKYPGSERFYARRPFLFSPYRKPFILKPDSSVKYYLIIKDPLTHRVTN